MTVVTLLAVSQVFFCVTDRAYPSVPFGSVEKAVLDNGATVICKNVPDSLMVTMRIRVMSGLSNEGEYAGSGISHFLEHLIFKGTRSLGTRELHDKIKGLGGIMNASTGFDSAEYHITVPKENFEEAFGLLADMVMELVFSDEDMRNERQVILKEVRLHRDDPISYRTQVLFSQAYRRNIYKYPIIGYEDLLEKLSREDIFRYHSSVYTPDRMVIGIAGGIPAREALRVARDKMEKYDRGAAWTSVVEREPRQISEDISIFPVETTLAYMAIGFHGTDVYSEKLYAGDVLSILLGQGEDSRLYKSLVNDKQLLYSVSSMNYTPRYPGLFVVTGIGPPRNMEKARDEIFRILRTAALEEVSGEELERARNLVISGYLHSHENIGSIASSMTNSQLLTGTPDFFQQYVERIKDVRAEEVLSFTREHLVPENSTTVFLMPKEQYQGASAVPVTVPGAVRQDAVSAPEVAGAQAAEEGNGPELTERLRLANGLTIIVKKRDRLPLAAVTLAVPGGVRVETESDNGISNMVASVMLKGTKNRTEEEIVPVIEGMGGKIESFSGMNSAGVIMDVLADDLDKAMDILEDVVRNATFPGQQFEREKKKVIASIREQETDVFENGVYHLMKLLYGEHPYGMRRLGKVETVEALSRGDVRAFYEKSFDPRGAVLTVVGDVDPSAEAASLSRRFAGWKGRENAIHAEQVLPLSGILVEDLDMDKEQALLLLGFQGVKLDDKRRYPLDLVSSLLSGSGGLLFYALREEDGLTYTTGASSTPQPDKGYFVLYAATTEENLEKAEYAVFEVLRKIGAGEITENEITSSKNRLISQHAYSLETNSAISTVMALNELYGLGYDDHEKYPREISSVSREDIMECAAQVLDLDEYALVRVHSRK